MVSKASLRVKQQILEDLNKAVKSLGYASADIVCTISKNPSFGDYSTNVALQLAKLLGAINKQSPQDIANQILQKFGKPDYLEKAEIAGGGFINFFIKKEFLANDIKEILESKEQFGKSEIGKSRKARVEFVSANPTGPLHFGNARGGPIGDVLANVLQFCGFEVLREYYDNNIGGQVKKLGESIVNIEAGGKPEDQEYKGEYVAEIVSKIGECVDSDDAGSKAVGLLFQEIIKDCSDLGIIFDKVYHESDFVNTGATKKVLDELEKKDFLKKYEGATWFAPKDEFLEDRECVVVKSDGEYTYFANDIVYHRVKFSEGHDLVINILGANHHGHVPRLQAAITALGFDVKRYRVILYQWVRFKSGGELIKMSKRSGTFVTAREVLDEVGKDALRFSLLQYSPQTHIDLDLDLYKQKSNKNPVFYVQYAHARMNNIIQKAKARPEQNKIDYGLLKDTAELNLIKYLLVFPDLVVEIAHTLQVQNLTEYAITLADLFHKFYENCPVLQAKTGDLKEARLALVRAAKITLGNTLGLLGVSAPEKM